jgi:DNA-binding FrmR family transcriptional regulator
MELPADDLKAITTRMKRAHGHLAHVIQLMEDGADCEAVLTQLAAVTKALSRSGYAIVATGLQHCVTEGGGIDGEDAKRMEKLFLSLA